MQYTWKITYGSGKDAVVNYFMTINSMATGLASMARNAKSDQFNVEKINDTVRERPAGEGPDSVSGSGTEGKGKRGRNPREA